MHYIPINIDLEVLHLKGNEIVKEYRPSKMERIISLIVYRENYSYLFDYSETRIHTDHFKKIAKNYSEYLLLLKLENHLHVGNSYKTSKYSKAYSINPQYTEFHFRDNILEEGSYNYVDENEDEDNESNENINKNFFNKDESFRSSLDLDHLINAFCFLEMEIEKAFLQADVVVKNLIANPERKLVKKWILKNGTSVLSNVYEGRNPKQVLKSHNLSISQFKYKCFNEIKRDSTIGRLYTPLTSLSKEYRHLLTINGEELGSVDISNCQPFLSLLLFDPSFWYFDELPNETKKKLIDYFPDLKTNPSKITIENLGYKENAIRYINYDRLLDALKNLVDDFEIFKREVLSGNLYKYIGEELAINGFKEYDKNKIKTIIFTVLFTANQYIGQAGALPKRIFKKMFPSIYNVFNAIKSIHSPVLAWILQRIESHMILDIIVPMIQKDSPDLPIYTIHDSICSYSTETEYIANKISDAFVDNMGYAPHLKKENWKKIKIL